MAINGLNSNPSQLFNVELRRSLLEAAHTSRSSDLRANRSPSTVVDSVQVSNAARAAASNGNEGSPPGPSPAENPEFYSPASIRETAQPDEQVRADREALHQQALSSQSLAQQSAQSVQTLF